MSETPVALITGAAQRIGATVAQRLHQRGYNIALHYRSSATEARQLAENLNQQRPDSCSLHQADLIGAPAAEQLAREALSHWSHIDVLINNASAFYPTSVGEASESDWDALIGSNLKAPFFLSQALADSLRQQQGCIINMADIYAQKPLKNHSLYCMAKAGLVMMTRSLARELSPEVRVNAVAPGAILWPEEDSEFSQQEQEQLLQRVPLQRVGEPADIARSIEFLICEAPYVTGQVLAVDGGRSLSM